MGQYYLICNLDKREYLNPHRFGDGLKLMEFGISGEGTMAGAAILLADGNGRGCGDLASASPLIGSWVGNRIVIAGDYADGGKFLDGVPVEELQAIANECYTEGYRQAERVNLYAYANKRFTDISDQVLLALVDDAYHMETLQRQLRDRAQPDHYLPLPKPLRDRLYGSNRGKRAANVTSQPRTGS